MKCEGAGLVARTVQGEGEVEGVLVRQAPSCCSSSSSGQLCKTPAALRSEVTQASGCFVLGVSSARIQRQFVSYVPSWTSNPFSELGGGRE